VVIQLDMIREKIRKCNRLHTVEDGV